MTALTYTPSDKVTRPNTKATRGSVQDRLRVSTRSLRGQYEGQAHGAGGDVVLYVVAQEEMQRVGG